MTEIELLNRNLCFSEFTQYVNMFHLYKKQGKTVKRMMKITHNKYNAIMRNSSFTFQIWNQ